MLPFLASMTLCVALCEMACTFQGIRTPVCPLVQPPVAWSASCQGGGLMNRRTRASSRLLIYAVLGRTAVYAYDLVLNVLLSANLLCSQLLTDAEHLKSFFHIGLLDCRHGENCNLLKDSQHREKFSHKGLPDILIPWYEDIFWGRVLPCIDLSLSLLTLFAARTREGVKTQAQSIALPTSIEISQ